MSRWVGCAQCVGDVASCKAPCQYAASVSAGVSSRVASVSVQQQQGCGFSKLRWGSKRVATACGNNNVWHNSVRCQINNGRAAAVEASAAKCSSDRAESMSVRIKR